MEDVEIIGESVERNADGTLAYDMWITKHHGDRDKSDVELVPCSSFIRSEVMRRRAEERGRHPGEQEPWDLPPTPPQ